MGIYIDGYNVAITREFEKKLYDGSIKFQGGAKIAKYLYTYQIDATRMLISGSYKDFGLWIYTEGEEYATQIYSAGAFKDFARVENLILITNGSANFDSSSLPGYVITLDLDTFEITKLLEFSSDREKTIYAYGTKALIFGDDQAYIYDFIERKLTSTNSYISNIRNSAVIDDVFISGGSSNGSYYVDLKTFEITYIKTAIAQVSTVGKTSHLHKLNDDEYLFYGSKDLALFNRAEKTITILATETKSGYLDKYIEVGDKILFYGENYGSGIVVFNKLTKTAIAIASPVGSSYLYNAFTDGLNCLFTSSGGLIYYAQT